MVYSTIDELIARSSSVSSKRRRERLQMYSHALAARLRQLDFCLQCLSDVTGSTKIDAASTAGTDFDDHMKAEFFCDVFWTWVYSSLDILAQVLNQSESLGLSEEKVSFNLVVGKLRSLTAKPTAFDAVDALEKSHLRTWMNAYRNCANHRRPICVWHEESRHTVSETYQRSSAPVLRRVHYICDHSVAINPKEHRRQELLPRCTTARDTLHKRVMAIINCVRR